MGQCCCSHCSYYQGMRSEVRAEHLKNTVFVLVSGTLENKFSCYLNYVLHLHSRGIPLSQTIFVSQSGHRSSLAPFIDPIQCEQYVERAYEQVWSQLKDRKPVEWPSGKKLALWVNVGLQFYPLNQTGKPFKVPGGMTMPYPDLRPCGNHSCRLGCL